MADPLLQGRAVRFGVFELDPAAGQLRKNGLRVRLQDQPFQLLAALVARPGEVVTREDLKEKLWPSDTYVDFDRSLNTAASKLREALGDSATSPRFIETLPRRGYRFLASVEGVREAGLDSGATASGDTEGESTADESESRAEVLARAVQNLEHKRRRVRAILVATLALFVVAIAAFLTGWIRPPSGSSPNRSLKFSIVPRMGVQGGAISPNGDRLVFVSAEGRGALWLQGLDEWEPREIQGTEGARSPFWSPDSQWIAFFQEKELKRVLAAGGSPTMLCRAPGEFNRSGTWSPDGDTIVFSSGEKSRLYKVPSVGGEPEPLFEPSSESREHPHFLPIDGGKQVLLYSTFVPTDASIYVADLETGERRALTKGTRPVYSATGHVLYQTAPIISGVRALPFSLDTLRPTGEAFPVAPEGLSPSVADNGTLVYGYSPQGNVQLGWRDRDGNKLEQIGQSQSTMRHQTLSPDERRVATSGLVDGNIDVFVYELSRPVRTRISVASQPDNCPLWSPSGDEIAFSSMRNGNMDIFLNRADGSGDAVPLAATKWKEFATDWSTDGKYILYDRSGQDRRNDVWYLQRTDDGKFEPTPFLASQFDQRAAQFSPNGKYVAYVSNQAGRYEVYVATFPTADRKWTASHDGGTQPRWRQGGSELYYVNNDILYAVKVTDKPEFTLGSPDALFQAECLAGGPQRRYDVSRDGRFLVGEPTSDAPPTVRVVQNWFEEFRGRPGGDN